MGNENFMLMLGDMRESLSTIPSSSIDVCITDPPYEIDFMGSKWDSSGISFQAKTWRNVYRVLKPGSHLLAFGGTRTFHRIAVAIEDAGFEIRDILCWLHGQGFPKSMDVSLAIDESYGKKTRGGRVVSSPRGNKIFNPSIHVVNSGNPNTELAKKYYGFGTSLKPAFEPIIMARKPFPGTVAQNIARFGTGAINIDSCRIVSEDEVKYPTPGNRKIKAEKSDIAANNVPRFPANVLLSCECDGDDHVTSCPVNILGDNSRFFYQAKASQSERNLGLVGMKTSANRINAPRSSEAEKYSTKKENFHPTVKPIKLMEWLVVLVSPPDGVVLDPFMGSGTTGIACMNKNFYFIGCEQDKDFFNIASARIKHAAREVGREENGDRS